MRNEIITHHLTQAETKHRPLFFAGLVRDWCGTGAGLVGLNRDPDGRHTGHRRDTDGRQSGHMRDTDGTQTGDKRDLKPRICGVQAGGNRD